MYVFVCLIPLPGVAPSRASLMSDGRSQSGTIRTTIAPNLCAGAYYCGKTARALPSRGEGWPSVLRGHETLIFLKAKN